MVSTERVGVEPEKPETLMVWVLVAMALLLQ
jgi:hypothetical protein